VEPGRLRVRADLGGGSALSPAPVEFRPGASDVVLAFRAGGGVCIRLEGSIPEDALRVRLEAGAGVVPPHARGTRVPVSRETKEHRWSALWPGRYRLVAEVLGDAQPVLVHEGIDVREGETTTLGPWPLAAAAIRQVTVRMVDDAGQPLRRAAVIVHPARGEQAIVLPAPEGEATVALTAASAEVVATAPGRRAVRMALAADVTVCLGLAGTRTLSAAGPPPTLPPDVKLCFEVHAVDTPAALRESHDLLREACAALVARRSLPLDAAGRCRFPIAQPGRYRVVPVLMTLKTDYSYRVEVEGAAREIVVADEAVGTDASLPIDLPEPALARALRRVRELLAQ
jgi:hypothetical protein